MDKFDPKGMWEGQTVAVIGNAPHMATAGEADRFRDMPTIVANRAVLHAPWADVFVSLDDSPEFFEQAREAGFEGSYVVGVPGSRAESDFGASYLGMFYERALVAPGNEVEIRNNYLAAMRIAQMGGAKRIVCAGLDPEAYEVQEREKGSGFYGFAAALAAVEKSLAESGVEVLHE